MNYFKHPRTILAAVASTIVTAAFLISTGVLNSLFVQSEREVAPYAYLLDINKEVASKITKRIEVKPRKAIVLIDVNDWTNYPVPKGNGSFEDYAELFEAVSNATGVPAMTLAKMAAVESGFQADAVAKCPKGVKCNAKGLFQFIDGTWDITVAKHGKRFGFPAKADPLNPVQNTLMAAMHIKDNIELLETVIPDREITVTDLYMVHFLGRSGAVRFFTANFNNKAAYSHRLAAKGNFNIFYNKKNQARTYHEVYAFLDNRLETRVSDFMSN